MRDCVILGGTSHPDLLKRISRELDIEPIPLECQNFSNGETCVKIIESVREKNVYVVQTSCGEVNDALMELMITISACKAASARSVVAVMPLFPYSRQLSAPKLAHRSNVPLPTPSKDADHTQTDYWQRKGKGGNYRPWSNHSGETIAMILATSGADHIITMELHDPQYQGYFDIPVDNLYGRPLLEQYINAHIANYKDAVIVSPDAGGAKRATIFADHLGLPFALIHKDLRNNTALLVGDVRGRPVLIVDDMIDSGRTMIRAAKMVKDHGAVEVIAVCTHGLFAGDCVARLKRSCIDKLVTTNSVPQDQHRKELGDMLQVVDVAPILAEAVRRIHNGESISLLFDRAIDLIEDTS